MQSSRIAQSRPNISSISRSFQTSRSRLLMRRSTAPNKIATAEAPSEAPSENAPDGLTNALFQATQEQATSVKSDLSGPLFSPTTADNKAVKILAPLAAIALVAAGSGFFPARLAAFAHLTAYSTYLGTIIWNTFFVGLTMFKVLAGLGQRQAFGKVQSKLFPAYFALTTGCVAVMLATAAMAGSVTEPKVLGVLSVSLALSLVNWLGIEPIATKLMFERYDLESLPAAEKTEETKAKIGTLYKSFGKFHGISSLINLLITCLAFAHGWFLSSKFTL
jgi:hypothetical protein